MGSWDESDGVVRKYVTSRTAIEYQLIIFAGAGDPDPVDDNVDVEVRFLDGARWGATFYTPDNLKTLLARWQLTGEYRSGLYFWANWTIIVRRLDRETIEATVEGLLEDDEFESAFERFPNK